MGARRSPATPSDQLDVARFPLAALDPGERQAPAWHTQTIAAERGLGVPRWENSLQSPIVVHDHRESVSFCLSRFQGNQIGLLLDIHRRIL